MVRKGNKTKWFQIQLWALDPTTRETFFGFVELETVSRKIDQELAHSLMNQKLIQFKSIEIEKSVALVEMGKN